MPREILTGRHPYHEFEASANRSHLVEQLYQDNEFPDIINLPLGQLMQGCWHDTFNSMSEVLQALEAAKSMAIKAKDGATVTQVLRSYRLLARSVCSKK